MNDDFCRLVSDHLIQEDVKEERTSLVYTIVGALCFFFLLALAATWPTNAHAAPIYKAEDAEMRIVLTDEDCKLTNVVTNLPKRATWVDKNGKYEGCYAIHDIGIVVAYFSDKTVAILPAYIFQKVAGA